LSSLYYSAVEVNRLDLVLAQIMANNTTPTAITLRAASARHVRGVTPRQLNGVSAAA
jgi:hypothetical protein